MSSENSNTVLVVGAGPTGLVMAGELARHGIPCRIVDKASVPSAWSKAIGIQARTLELFENMGIAAEFTTRGWKSRGMNVFADGQRIAHLAFDTLDSPFPYLLFLPQSQTERILTARLEGLGVTMERGVELTDLTPQAEGVVARLRHDSGEEETTEFAWLVGCDGAHSRVRHLLGMPFEGTSEPAQFLLADVAVANYGAEEEFTVFLHPEGLLAIFPMGGGRYRLIADNPPGGQGSAAGPAPDQEPSAQEASTQQASTQAPPTLEQCQAIVRERAHNAMELSDPQWTAYFRINYRMLSQFRAGRVFMAGDAVNIHSPAGAQGMNTGIQDAYNLAWKLALVMQNVAAPALLDSYQVERYPVEKGVQRGSHLLTQAVSLHNPVALYLRNHLVPLLLNQEGLQRRIRETISELAVHYRHSPIVEEHGPGGGVPSGDRAPDAALLSATTGTPRRLFEALQGTQHTLLLFSGADAAIETIRAMEAIATRIQSQYGDFIHCYFVVHVLPAAWQGSDAVLLDADGGLSQRYGNGLACLYLIRPDGYVGFRSPLGYEARLFAYLTRWFRAQAAMSA